MIVEFTVGNFLSFNEKRTISFAAQGGVSELKDNTFTFGKQKLLRSIVIYGANSSGKSNLIKAFERMRFCIISSVKLNDKEKLSYNPFLLSTETIGKPTFFEIIFILKDKTYRYGFEYAVNKIISEWLFVVKSSQNEEPLFVRSEDGIGVSAKYHEGKEKEKATNDNRLFLSLVAQLGGEIAKQILEWFYNFGVISGITHTDYESYTLNMLHQDLEGKADALKFFSDIQLGFNDIEVAVSDDNEFSINTTHNLYNKNGNITDKISWNKEDNESEGTKKIIDLSGPLFNTLLHGKVLIVDELDSKLHPLITLHIIKLFNNPETNPNNAQLLFATHDTNLLSTEIFRRDQIWFTEKDELEQTDLYALDDFVFADGTKVRKDANLEKNYIAGRYGAIPYIINS